LNNNKSFKQIIRATVTLVIVRLSKLQPLSFSEA